MTEWLKKSSLEISSTLQHKLVGFSVLETRICVLRICIHLTDYERCVRFFWLQTRDILVSRNCQKLLELIVLCNSCVNRSQSTDWKCKTHTKKKGYPSNLRVVLGNSKSYLHLFGLLHLFIHSWRALAPFDIFHPLRSAFPVRFTLFEHAGGHHGGGTAISQRYVTFYMKRTLRAKLYEAYVFRNVDITRFAKFYADMCWFLFSFFSFPFMCR